MYIHTVQKVLDSARIRGPMRENYNRLINAILSLPKNDRETILPPPPLSSTKKAWRRREQFQNGTDKRTGGSGSNSSSSGGGGGGKGGKGGKGGNGGGDKTGPDEISMSVDDINIKSRRR